jgi:hypothetical protein
MGERLARTSNHELRYAHSVHDHAWLVSSRPVLQDQSNAPE